jgi:L-ascorbate metabolism protein UlaG (beta-lactamase superfamily)
MKITMVGHSTVLIEACGKRILTDPYFGSWGNPAYARIAPAFKPREAFTSVDLVLVSHNHWDHTDSGLFRALTADVSVLAPRASAWMTRLKGGHNVSGMSAWQQKTFGDIRVTAVPAAHVTVTRGYVIEAEGKSVYFAGDTYFRSFMKEIGRRFKLDVALLPVTTYRIPLTMGEESAVRAVEALCPRVVIPIHFGIAPRSPLLRTKQSRESFRNRVEDAGLKTEVRILGEGESWREEPDSAAREQASGRA